MPSNIEIQEVKVSGVNATILALAKTMDSPSKGTITLFKEGNDWKIVNEDWNVELNFTNQNMEVPSNGEKPSVPKEIILKDPTKLPTPHVIIRGRDGMASSLSFSSNGKYLFTASYDDFSLCTWDLHEGKRKSFTKMSHRPGNMVLSKDGKSFLTSDVYHHIISWPCGDGVIGKPEPLMEEAGNYVALSPHGEWLATARYIQGPLIIWKTSSGVEVQKMKDTEKLRKSAFSSDNKLLAGTTGNTLHLWDTATWKSEDHVIPKVDPAADIGGIQFSSDGKYLGLSFMDSSIIIFDVPKRKVLHNFFVRNESAWDIQFSPNTEFFATAQQSGTIYLWNTKTGKQLGTLKHHKSNVRQLAFSADGMTLASTGEDKDIVLWRNGPMNKPFLIEEDDSEKEIKPIQEEPKPQIKSSPPSTPVKLDSKLFQVDGVMGDTITLNGNILVEVGKTFSFQHEAQVFTLKLLKIAEDHVEIQHGNEIISLPTNEVK